MQESAIVGSEFGANLHTVFSGAVTLYSDNEYMLDVLEHQRETLSDDHPELARTLYGLGVTHVDMGKPARVEFEEALRIQEAALGAEHPHTVQTRAALTNLPL